MPDGGDHRPGLLTSRSRRTEPRSAAAGVSPLSVAGRLDTTGAVPQRRGLRIAMHAAGGGLRAPRVEQSQWGRHEAEKILGFAIGFLVIGLFWMGHHRLFRYITAPDQAAYPQLDSGCLGAIAFLPYPTALRFVSIALIRRRRGTVASDAVISRQRRGGSSSVS